MKPSLKRLAAALPSVEEARVLPKEQQRLFLLFALVHWHLMVTEVGRDTAEGWEQVWSLNGDFRGSWPRPLQRAVRRLFAALFKLLPDDNPRREFNRRIFAAWLPSKLVREAVRIDLLDCRKEASDEEQDRIDAVLSALDGNDAGPRTRDAQEWGRRIDGENSDG